ncbi:MAG: hypothetical protein MHMPM18_002623 [Marteilia pararefringens]
MFKFQPSRQAAASSVSNMPEKLRSEKSDKKDKKDRQSRNIVRKEYLIKLYALLKDLGTSGCLNEHYQNVVGDMIENMKRDLDLKRASKDDNKLSEVLTSSSKKQSDYE